MKHDRSIVRCIIIVIIFMVLGNLAIGNIAADGPGGPHSISGIVYNSDGKDPGEGYEGTYVAVIWEHEGVKYTWADPDGLKRDTINNTWWYTVTIPTGAWDIGDRYWIWIDGTGWGDYNFTCRAHGEDTNSWEMTEESEQRDVDTGDYNFKPPIAWIFAIILAVVGIIIGISRPLRIPFSGRPKQPSDLVDDIVIGGAAQMPGELPEEAAVPAAAEEERTCDTCGGKLEYIPEYGSWYCYVCKKYPEEEEKPPSEEELPPPDEAPPEEEPPPPEDELPPPEDELPPPEQESPPPGGA
jgi:hypothetical protein